MLLLNQLVTFNPISVTPETPIDQLVDMLHGQGLHHWPVVNSDREVVGMVSETDLVRSAHMNMLAGAGAASPEVNAAAGVESRWEPCTVAEIMSPRVVTVDLNAPARVPLKLLLDHQLQALPVVRDGHLTAIVTAGDFLREFSYGETPASQESVARNAIPFEDTVEATATLDEALATMFATECKFVAVMRGGLPIGIVSHRELAKARCRQTATELTSGEMPAGALLKLAADSVTFKPGIKMAEAAAILFDRNREAGIVVNQANRMVGMLTAPQILQAMLPSV